MSPSLRGRGLKSVPKKITFIATVALFTRAWIEMISKPNAVLQMRRRPLYEGVD